MQRNTLKNFIKKKTKSSDATKSNNPTKSNDATKSNDPTNLNDKEETKENINLLSTSSTADFHHSSTSVDDTNMLGSSSPSCLKSNSYESPKKIPRTSISSLENQMLGWSVSDEIKANLQKLPTPKEEKKDSSKTESRYDFLLDVRDKEGRREGDEGYDSSTLFISDSHLQKMTPFERQFWEIKKDYWDTVVFFKKGKFYELYEGDADIASKLFNFRITDRVNMRMAGFPESTLDDWICKFLEAGYKVARVDQSENMIAKKIREKGSNKDKIIKRELKEIITQGTIYDANHLKTSNSVYTLIIRENLLCDHENCPLPVHFSILLFDACTLQVFYRTFCDDKYHNELRNICVKYTIREYVSKKKFPFMCNHVRADEKRSNSQISILTESENECYTYLYNYMKYLNREKTLNNLRFIKFDNLETRMILDSSTIINMDILSDLHDKTLFNAINFCSTPFGQRKLKNWMLSPLANGESIRKRQNLVKYFDKINITTLTDNFKQLGDFERMFSKLRSGNSKFKDLKIFMEKLEIIQKIYEIIDQEILANGSHVSKEVHFFDEIVDNNKIIYVPMKNLNNFLEDYKLKYLIKNDEIVPGKVNSEDLVKLLDEKEALVQKFNDLLDREKININCKDIVYKNIGKEIFQLEIPKNIKVPDEYFLVSNTKAVNRYYTSEIRSYISEFVELEERIFQSHGSLYAKAVEYLLNSETLFFNIIPDLSTLDCLISFSIFNSKIRGCVPVESTKLNVKDLGNPIYKDYVTNDYLEEKKILILTGSNMAGKSTFMRSLCLNTILFHMGLNVVASKFESPIFDKLFSRMGASDNLVRGESTFMIELLETSNILKNATCKSLVIMDELGRGTSTKDGECIAKAVLTELKNINCTVFFSTHYHNLIFSEKDFSTGYMNTIIKNNEVIFLYKLVKGMCEDSNGIYVARLAGVPEEILALAEKYKEEFKKMR